MSVTNVNASKIFSHHHIHKYISIKAILTWDTHIFILNNYRKVEVLHIINQFLYSAIKYLSFLFLFIFLSFFSQFSSWIRTKKLLSYALHMHIYKHTYAKSFNHQDTHDILCYIERARTLLKSFFFFVGGVCPSRIKLVQSQIEC